MTGLHLSFVGMGFYRLVRRITGSYGLGGVLGISFLLLYILMIGGSVSAVRALVMFCIRVAADMSGRVYDGPTSVAAAAAGIILWRPLSFYDAGFQLSFEAVCGIIFFCPPSADSSFKGRIFGSLKASLWVQLATLPAILFHYCEYPPYALVLNLLVIPSMSLLLALGFAGSILCLVCEGLGCWCFSGCRGILRLYEILCQWFLRIPGSRIVTGQPAVSGILIYSLCLVWLALSLRGERKGSFRPAAAVCGMLALVISCPAVSHRGLEVTFLDVGQGDGIFLRERGGLTCLIDGGSSDVSGVGRYCMEPFLKARGVSRVDYVFVTHGDEDHVSGLKELIERQEKGVEIQTLVFPERKLWDEGLEELCRLAGREGISMVQISPGQQISGRELKLSCLAPDGSLLQETGNEASLVLEASWGELDLLFAGDVEGRGEELLTEAVEKEYEVLKVAHHGSRNSTGDAFLGKVSPLIGVISAGRDNSYGHPHEETLSRLEERGTAVFQTARSGALILKLTGKEVANLRIIQYNKFYEKFE